jgi:hypothetical protein
MRDYPLRYARARTFFAICAGAFGVVLCIKLNHFTLDLQHPAGFYTFARHRCGQVLIAATVWCGIECANLWAMTRGRRTDLRSAQP